MDLRPIMDNALRSDIEQTLHNAAWGRYIEPWMLGHLQQRFGCQFFPCPQPASRHREAPPAHDEIYGWCVTALATLTLAEALHRLAQAVPAGKEG